MDTTDEKIKKQLLSHMPQKFASLLEHKDFTDLREIRFRVGQKAMLYYGNKTLPFGSLLSPSEISKCLECFCKSSVYAYLNEIKNGFITLSGGHRVGISGECVVKGGEITNIHSFYGINIRIAKQFVGCSLDLMPYIFKNTIVQNTIIIAPPACGKTTMLRDIARHLSHKMKVTVIDERDEICALHNGVSHFCIGPQTDVLSKAPKSQGTLMALRSLSPEVIITDEVGTDEDIYALGQALGAGCKIITSIHGYSAESIKQSKGKLLGLFDIAIELCLKDGIPTIYKVVNTEDIKL